MTGLIRVGGTSPADVLLPVDVRARELKLACQLLGQLVKTRRKYVREQRRVRVLRELAHSDPLTGLANRRGWEDGSRRLLDLEGVADHWAVAIFDLDDFKQVNRRFGYAVGDAALRAFAVRLNECMPPHALLARLGGDEFVALVPLEERSRAVEVVDQWRRQATSTAESAILPGVSVSAGVAPVLNSSASDIVTKGIEQADRALRLAKERGRNCTVMESA
jgi:diguanylate cyclase (GGDEF)-like protein